VATDDMVVAWYEGFLEQRLGSVPAGCTSDTKFVDLGLDSMDSVVMAAHLEDALHQPLEPEMFLAHACLSGVIDTLFQRGLLVLADRKAA
jgi:acyl carrier protein